jgi:hypothetical protein
MLTFLDGGLAEYVAGRPLMTELATRAIYENVANLCDFTERLKPLCDELDFVGIDDHIMTAAFVTRIPSFLEQQGDSLKAPHILKQIDKMVKRAPTFRQAYDHLSDLVHPNGLGAVVYFSTIENNTMKFVDDAVELRRPVESLFLAAVLFAFVELEVNDIESRLQKLNVVATGIQAIFKSAGLDTVLDSKPEP